MLNVALTESSRLLSYVNILFKHCTMEKPGAFGGPMTPEIPDQMHGARSAKLKFKKQMANGMMKVNHLSGLSSCVVRAMTERKKLILVKISNGGNFGNSAF